MIKSSKIPKGKKVYRSYSKNYKLRPETIRLINKLDRRKVIEGKQITMNAKIYHLLSILEKFKVDTNSKAKVEVIEKPYETVEGRGNQ
jgi:hypothetical protein